MTTSPAIRNVFDSRWKFPDIARFKPIRTGLNSILDAHDKVRERHAEASKDQKKSPLGRLDDLRDHIARLTAPAIQRARATVKATREASETWRARLAPKPLDPAEQALGAEMRAFVRTLPPAKSAALLTSRDADPLLVRAVLTTPAFLSGISDDLRARVLNGYLNRHHAADLSQIDQTEEATDLLEAAIGVTLGAAKAVAEFPSEQLFNDFVEKAAPTTPVIASDPLLQRLSEIKAIDNPLPTETPEETHARFLAEARVSLTAAGLL